MLRRAFGDWHDSVAVAARSGQIVAGGDDDQSCLELFEEGNDNHKHLLNELVSIEIVLRDYKGNGTGGER